MGGFQSSVYLFEGPKKWEEFCILGSILANLFWEASIYRYTHTHTPKPLFHVYNINVNDFVDEGPNGQGFNEQGLDGQGHGWNLGALAWNPRVQG